VKVLNKTITTQTWAAGVLNKAVAAHREAKIPQKIIAAHREAGIPQKMTVTQTGKWKSVTR